MTMKRIVHKYRQQVSLEAGVGGNHHVTAMKDYVQVYIKFMLMINPKLYLTEIRDNQGLIGYAGTHVPMFVHKLGLTKPRQT